MEIVTRESIKIPNSVIVSGLQGNIVDDEVGTYLEKYGEINRRLLIDDKNSDFHRHLIIEFKSETAIETLKPQLPLGLKSSTHENIVFDINSLASVYTLNARVNATKTYMDELRALASLSGSSLEQLLKEELEGLALSSTPPPPKDSSSDQSPLTEQTVQIDPPSSSSHPSDLAVLTSPLDTTTKNLTDSPLVSATPAADQGKLQPTIDLNPPSVQRVVVEHVVRSSEASSRFTTSSRLRAFSGKSPRPNNEADYDTWRTSVEVLMKDPSVSDLQCTHRILDSLLPPAAGLIKHLDPQARPSAYLELLDSAYGTVEDGDELYARFMSTFMDSEEKPSAFLHRLHVCLSLTMRRGGVSAQEFDKQLLKQFCRGCWDNALITDLQLGKRKENPPSFPELLLMLRTEEDIQAAKVSRMRQHLGTAKPALSVTKQRTMSHLQTAHETADSGPTTEFEKLKKQIADLSAQLSSMKVEPQKQKSKEKAAPAKAESRPVKNKVTKSPLDKSKGKPRPWYCFQCGEDGHIKSACDNEPDPSLVAAKRKQLREKQSLWETTNAPDEENHLN